MDGHSDGRADFVKIDVEGMQMALLKGAEKMLRGPGPPIWIELHAFKNEFEEVEGYLRPYGYEAAHKLGAHDFIFVAD